MSQTQPYAPAFPAGQSPTHAPVGLPVPPQPAEDLSGARTDVLVALGELAQLRQAVAELAAYLRDDRLALDLDTLQTPSWTAGGFADLELGKMYPGVAIFNNDGTNDLLVGFAAGAGKTGRAVFTISARGWLAVPILTSHVSVGGAGAGPATVCPLNRAPQIAGGRF